MADTVIVTRHAGLVEWIKSRHPEYAGCEVLPHVAASDVLGKDVIGVLPVSLALSARSVREVVMNLPAEMRGKELTPVQMDEYGAKLSKPVSVLLTRDLERFENAQNWCYSPGDNA
jgi:putative CRISPR-associated protein (TIGR02620 family)